MSRPEDRLRHLPQVQKLLERPAAAALQAAHGRPALVAALRDELADLRARLRADPAMPVPGADTILACAAGRIADASRPSLVRVINATGIVLHTNLGRAPLAEAAQAAVTGVMAGYANLELDLATGRRGSRTAGVEPLIRALAGADGALVVNNGAAAILLAVAAIAGGGEVVVSRGELVEIGGGFRVPDIIAAGGARLVEVGSTNRTHLRDYAEAIGPDTRALLKVHQSNFRTIGFTGEVGIAALAGLGPPVIADLGSGLLRASPNSDEPTLRDAVSAGAAIVTCSGDKLLGGPQAGIVAGDAAMVDRLRGHPMMRALRLDKMSLAALEATLILHRDRPDAVPVQRMLGQGIAMLAARAERLRALVGGVVLPSEGFAGGGALPEQKVDSVALALGGDGEGDAERLADRLRTGDPAVVGRLHGGRLLIDMLTVADDELPALAAAVAAARM